MQCTIDSLTAQMSALAICLDLFVGSGKDNFDGTPGSDKGASSGETKT